MFATLLALLGCQAHHAVMGTVTDRNGEPIDRVIIKLEPGGVELVTDQNGYYEIDYLRDEAGERVRFARRTTYEIEAFKPGYHIDTLAVDYKRGELLLDPMVLKEDTIRVTGSDQDLDSAAQGKPTEAHGGSYEGE